MSVQPDFHLKLGDTGPLLERVAAFTDSSVQDLTGATLAWSFQKVDIEGNLDASNTPGGGPAAIVDATTGQWSYDWATDTPASAGMYGGELTFTLGALVVTFPQQGYLYFEVIDDIG